MVSVTVLYFASLRDASHTASEVIDTPATDLATLYSDLQQRHGFALPMQSMRVAVDGEFAQWHEVLRSGSEIAFIPPVSGG